MTDTLNAASILSYIHARDGQDYHTLNSDQVDMLVHFAKENGYRKPKNANGSTGRYFYAYLLRKVKRFRRNG